MSPCTLSKIFIIIYFLSFETRGHMLRNQNVLLIETNNVCHRCILVWIPFDTKQSLNRLPCLC